MANNIDWTKSLTTHPSYGAIPPLVQAFEANSIPNVTIGASTISSGLSGGYTIGNGGTGTSSNTVWTTGTTGAGSYRINDSAAVLSASGKMALKMTTRTVQVIEDPDNPEELLLDLGTELCEELGWKVGDTIQWIDNKDGTWQITLTGQVT